MGWCLEDNEGDEIKLEESLGLTTRQYRQEVRD